MFKSTIKDRYIIPPTGIELLVADHCNLSCRSCNHASPVMEKWFAKPETIFKDYSILAKYYRPRFVKVLGGEPLLHKNLIEILNAIRVSKISDYIMLITNGILLHKMSDNIWSEVDEVEVSLYPDTSLELDALDQLKKKAKDFSTKLTLNRYQHFRKTFSEIGTNNESLTNQVYQACKIANVWGCHSTYEGYFYKCPQSIYIPRLVSSKYERVIIRETPDFQAELYDFINSPVPLAACKYCLGTVGLQQKYVQVSHAKWKLDLRKSAEELVDYQCLGQSIGKPTDADLCKNTLYSK